MKNGTFVFDCVVHMHNLDPANLRIPKGPVVQERMYTAAATLSDRFGDPDAPRQTYADFAREWSVEALHDFVFDGTGVDMAMVQAVPLFDYWKDGISSVERTYEFHRAYPDKVVFCGGTDPVFAGVDCAVESVRTQITEWGAKSIKLYNGHAEGRSWRADDRTLAYPIYEAMLDLGCNLVQFHKGNPIGLEPMEDLQPYDLQRVAYDFPEMNIIIHHLGVPWVEETINIAARFPNIHLAMSTWVNSIHVQPVPVIERIGKILFECGPEKLLWGSEAPLAGAVRPLLDRCWEVQIPEYLQDGYGFPEISDSDRQLIYGGNVCRLLGIDAARTTTAGVAAGARSDG